MKRRLAGVAVAVAIAICGTRAMPAQDTPPRVIEIVLREGRASGPDLPAPARGAPTLRLTRGERVELRWTSDRTMDLHLHGYGIELRAAGDATTVMAFLARAAGRFAVETHDRAGRHLTVLYLEVHPR
jgi:FtsP/CotA-like multicopper oxidase with cupredoxin domain